MSGGLEQKTVCDRTGIGVSSMSEFENGVIFPSFVVLDILASTYRTTVWEIMREAETGVRIGEKSA